MFALIRIWLGLAALVLFLLLFWTSDEATATIHTKSPTKSSTKSPTKSSTQSSTQSSTKSPTSRGRYLVIVGGCNDCHTMGYGQMNGNIPESDWLVGGPIGFQGPWGTSYPINLRNMVDRMEKSEWVKQVKTAQALPPMPWFALHAMTNEDLSAMYAFIKQLGPKGEEAPAPLSPGVTPKTPYIDFVPKFPQ